MKVLLLIIPLVFLHTVATVEYKTGLIQFQKEPFLESVNSTSVLFKHENRFTATPVDQDSDEIQIKVGEELFMEQNESQTTFTPQSVVNVPLPEGKTLDDYIAFLISEYSSQIDRIVQSGDFIQEFADVISSQSALFAVKRCPILRVKHVYLNVVEVEIMLRREFRISDNKIEKWPSSLLSSRNLRNSMLFEILAYPELVKVYVYIPNDKTIGDFVRSVKPKTINVLSEVSDIFWKSLIAGLKQKDAPNVRKVHLKNLLRIVSTHYYESTFPNDVGMHSIMSTMGNSNYGRKSVNIPHDLTDNIWLNNCDKIYLDFGLMPFPNTTMHSSDILKDMVEKIYALGTLTYPVFSFAHLVSLLQNEVIQSEYATKILVNKTCKPTPFSIQSLNEAIAKQMNSAKFPIKFSPNEVIIQSIGSKFSMKRYNESIEFEHAKFPSDKEFASTEKERLEAYIEFVKGKVNSEQNEDNVKKEFLEFFWAEENVEEFGNQLTELIPFLKEEERIAIESEKRKEEEINNAGKKNSTTHASTTNTSNHSSNMGMYLITIVIFGGVLIIVVVVFYLQYKKKKKKRYDFRRNTSTLRQ